MNTPSSLISQPEMRRVVTSRGEDDRLGRRYDCSKVRTNDFPLRRSLQSFPCPVVPERAPSVKELPVDEKVGNIEIYLRIFGNTWEYLGDLVRELLSSTSVSATVSILFLFQKDNLWMKDEEEVEEERLRR